MKIIRIDQNNFTLLYSVAADVFDEEIDVDFLSRYVREENHIMLVALHENTIIAQVLSIIHKHPDKPTELYVDDLGVAPEFQREGIATLMMKQLFALRKEGVVKKYGLQQNLIMSKQRVFTGR